jgi:hypothetical protein
MSVNIHAWHQSYRSFEKQVEEFNNKVKHTNLTEENVNQIYQAVKQEVKFLNQYAEAAKAREEELEQGGYCCTPSRKAIWTIGSLNVVSKIFSVAGAVMAIVNYNPITQGIGAGMFALGETFDAATTIYEAKVGLDFEEVSALAKLHKESVEHAKIFQKFLKQLKEIKKMENQLLQEYRSHANHSRSEYVIINLDPTKNLDEYISACLNEYEELPACYRQEEIYCRIISHLIQLLPPDDPLYIGLAELDPIPKDISILADQPLPMRYLPTLRRSQSSSDSKWVGEAKAQSKQEVPQLKQVDSIDPQSEYIQRVAYYTYLVTQRFKLKHNVKFLETSTGWHINPISGIKKISESVENKSLTASSSIKRTIL